jgi:Cu2+-exporting ATPase
MGHSHGVRSPHGAHAHHGRHGSENSGHDKHAGHSVAMFRNKFWLTLLLTIPTMIWSPMIQQWFGYEAPGFAGSQYIAAVFGILVYCYGGWPFLRGAWLELRERQPGMMTLIALAITVALVYSLLVTLGMVGGMDLWWELATLVAIMLLGHWVEMRSIRQAQGALQELAKLRSVADSSRRGDPRRRRRQRGRQRGKRSNDLR